MKNTTQGRLRRIALWLILACTFIVKPLFAHSRPTTPLADQPLSPHLLTLADRAYRHAKQMGVAVHNPTMAIVDFSLPSNKKRLWVVDMRTHHILMNTLVAHGMGSGLLTARHFSNQARTHMTSLGLYLTGKTYVGHDGYSLRLSGLDKGYNNNAKRRAVIMHGANYVNQTRAAHGRIGRSWGCFAVSQQQRRRVINALKGGSLLLAYYPDHTWLSHSRYL